MRRWRRRWCGSGVTGEKEVGVLCCIVLLRYMKDETPSIEDINEVKTLVNIAGGLLLLRV